MDRAIESNTTWHINDFLLMKKNADWKKPVQQQEEQQDMFGGQQMRDVDGGGDGADNNNATDNIYSTFLYKATDFLRSRTLEFSIPQNDSILRSGRALVETGKYTRID